MAAERLDPVDQADQSRPLADVSSTYAVVVNRQVKVRTLGFDAHPDFRSVSVLGRICECFCNDVVSGQFNRSRQSALDSHLEADPDGGTAG